MSERRTCASAACRVLRRAARQARHVTSRQTSLPMPNCMGLCRDMTGQVEFGLEGAKYVRYKLLN